jgi:hypothetical protein
MDVNDLFTDQGLRQATQTWRDQHMEDARQYDQIRDIIKRRLEQERIDGDRMFAARRRAWRVSRQVKAMSRHARRQAARSEALYATYVDQVVRLPERRALAAARKDERRQQRAQAAGAMVAKSLHKSASVLGGDSATTEYPQVTGMVGRQDRFLDAEPFPFAQAAGAEGRHVGSIHDYFPQKGGR